MTTVNTQTTCTGLFDTVTGNLTGIESNGVQTSIPATAGDITTGADPGGPTTVEGVLEVLVAALQTPLGTANQITVTPNGDGTTTWSIPSSLSTGTFTSTQATGTAPFTVSSTTVVPNLSVQYLNGNTWGSPGAIGNTAASTGKFTSLTDGGGRGKNVRTVTASGAVTMGVTDHIVIIDKGTGAATAISLPASPVTGQYYTIKDGKGDANTNNITITPNSGNIDGSSTLVISSSYGIARLLYNGTQWYTV